MERVEFVAPGQWRVARFWRWRKGRGAALLFNWAHWAVGAEFGPGWIAGLLFGPVALVAGVIRNADEGDDHGND